jgi:hypothetical protein
LLRHLWILINFLRSLAELDQDCTFLLDFKVKSQPLVL